MLDYVQKYFDAVSAADKEYSEKTNALMAALVSNKRGAARAQGEREYRLLSTALGNIRESAKAIARAQLALDGDVFVAWMVANCAAYPGHVDAVIRILPADLDAVRKVAQEQSWCGEFDRLVASAMRDGILMDGYGKERAEFADWLRSNWGVRETHLGDLMQRAEKVFTAEAKIAKKKDKPLLGVKPEAEKKDKAVAEPATA